MAKVEVTKYFTLDEYDKLKNVVKLEKREDNEFGVGDTFECNDKMVDFLMGNNKANKVVVRVLQRTINKKKNNKKNIEVE